MAKLSVTKIPDEFENMTLFLFVDPLSLPKLVERLELFLIIFGKLSKAASSDLEVVKIFRLSLVHPSVKVCRDVIN
jgi:hypothetical protein